MNGIIALDASFCLHAALTLLHFLWQGLLVAMIACLSGWCLQNRSAAARYRVYTAAMVLMLACLPATLCILRLQDDASAAGLVRDQHAPLRSAKTSLTAPDGGPALALNLEPAATSGPNFSPRLPNTAASPVSQTAVPGSTDRTNPSPSRATSPVASTGATSTVEAIARWTLAGYLLGVSLMFTRTLLGFSGTRRLRLAAQPLTDAALLEAVRRRARQFSLRRAPVVAYCNRVAVPALVGLLRPMILLPTVLATGLTPEQLELVVVHELAHIRRWDNAWLIVQRTIESILFFHPTVWYISRRMSVERELCCDEIVVATAARPSQYAESLLRVVELTSSNPVTVPVGATMTSPRDGSTFLIQRLMRILGEAKTSPVRLPRLWPTLVVALLVVAIVGLLRMNASDHPELVAAEAVPAEKLEEREDAGNSEPPPEERERRIACKTPFMVLPESGCIELIGVTEYPDEGTPAWKPNGEALESPLPAIDTAHVTDIEVPEGKIARKFRFNILGAGAVGDLTCSIKGAPGSAANHLDISGLPRRTERVWDTVLLLPSDKETVDLVVKASGTWRGFRLGHTEARPVPIEASEGAEVHENLPESLASRRQIRAVVTAPDGRKVVATAKLGRSQNRRTPVVFRFPGMSVEQVRDYHLESREEGTITFYDVSVERAHRSDLAVGVLPHHFYWAMDSGSSCRGLLEASHFRLEQILWAEQGKPGTYDTIEIAETRRQRDRWEYAMRQVHAIAVFFSLQTIPTPAVISFATDDVTAPEKSLARLIAHHELYRRHAEGLDGNDPQWRRQRKSLMSSQVDPDDIGVGWHAQFFNPASETSHQMGRIEKALLAELEVDQDEIFMRSPTGALRYLQRIRAEKSCVNVCHLSTTGAIFLEPPDGDRLEPGDVLAILGVEIMPEPPKFARVNLKGAYPSAKAPTEPLENTVAPAGQCCDLNGGAIANAQVVLYRLDWPKRTQRVVERTRSDQHGAFQFAQVSVTQEKSGEYTVVATADGRATAFMTFPSRTIDGTQLELQMPEASELRGQVLGPNGTPVQGAMVWTHQPLPQPELGLQCTTTDEDGNFVIDDMAPGKCKPMVTAEDALEKTRRLVFPVYSHHPDVRYTWRSHQTVPGQVAFRLGPGAVLEALDVNAESGEPAAESGKTSQSVAKIVFPLYCRHPDFAYTWQTYQTVPCRVLFRLEPGAVIEGRVVYAASGEPAAGIAVGIQNSAKGDYQQAITDKQGRYRFKALRPEKYSVWINSPEWTASATDSLEVVSGETKETPDLKLVRGATISGRLVHGVTGKPLTLADFHSLFDETRYTSMTVTVPARSKPGPGEQAVDIASDGSFQLHVPPGKNTIKFSPPAPWSLVDYPTGLDKTFSLAEGQHLRLDLWVEAD
jgi:beta-lactamase regulating signal transducer with metallopeptidase domain